MKPVRNAVGVRTRIGKIRYTNCLPFYYQLGQWDHEIDFFESVPAQINNAMSRGEIDLAPVSSLEYLNHQSQYILLPGFNIGARDFSGSVLLFSREKIEGLNGINIAVTDESLSSVTLLKCLLRFKYKFENEFTVSSAGPGEMLKSHQAALVIGDSALYYRPESFVYKYDLSELWWNWTGKPFCFALWAVRRKYAQQYPQELAAFCTHLRATFERNMVDIESLIRDGLDMPFWHEKFPKTFGYLFNLSYGLDGAMLEGLELFYRLANRLGVSPRPQAIEFFEGGK